MSVVCGVITSYLPNLGSRYVAVSANEKVQCQSRLTMEVNEGRMAPLVASQTLTPRPHPLFRAGILEPPPPPKVLFFRVKNDPGVPRFFYRSRGHFIAVPRQNSRGQLFSFKDVLFSLFLFRFFSVVPPANLDPGSQRDKPNKVRVPAVAQREKDRKQGP